MKAFMQCAFSVLVITAVCTQSINAGTLSAGVQSYYAWWDSGMAKMTAGSVEAQLQREMEAGVAGIPTFDSFSDLEVSDPEGRGFIYGPILGFRTDDRKWDFTLAIMWFGSYTTSVDASVRATGTFPIIGAITQTLPISAEFTIEHRDIDLQAGYMLTELFRVFAGYKYQSYETGIEADYGFTFQGASMSAALDFTTSAAMHMPYLGGGIVHGISDWMTLRANLGFGLIVAGTMEQELVISGTYFNADYSFDGAKVEMAYCVMGNIALGMKFAESVNIEAGYQYQRFTFKVKDADLDADGQADDSGSETDVFHGFTVSAVYLFSL